MRRDAYTCEKCGETFESGWTEEEADAEAKHYWGVKNAHDRVGVDMAVVCDDCWEVIRPDRPENAVAYAATLAEMREGDARPGEGEGTVRLGDETHAGTWATVARGV